MAGDHPLVELFCRAEVNRFPGLAAVISDLLRQDLASRFAEQVRAAPLRGRCRDYFVRHTGRTASGGATNRREEHLTIALWRACREPGFVLPDATRLFPIEYQLPLKSHRNRANAGLGKVDLFCADSSARPWVVELKVHPDSPRGRIETPLKALLEALAYSAILDADIECLSRESVRKQATLGKAVAPVRPNLMVMAPAEYWAMCDRYERLHPWRQSLAEIAGQIETALGIQVRLVELGACAWGFTTHDSRPRLLTSPVFDWAAAPIRVPGP